MTDDTNKEKFVLVIEDSCDHAQSLLILLRMQGYRVECEADGRSGLNRVQAALPDLVMLDVTMPELNGADVWQSDPQLEGHRRYSDPHPDRTLRVAGSGVVQRLQRLPAEALGRSQMLDVVADLLGRKAAAVA
jgi:CheY-like chemotaxis protein